MLSTRAAQNMKKMALGLSKGGRRHTIIPRSATRTPFDQRRSHLKKPKAPADLAIRRGLSAARGLQESGPSFWQDFQQTQYCGFLSKHLLMAGVAFVNTIMVTRLAFFLS